MSLTTTDSLTSAETASPGSQTNQVLQLWEFDAADVAPGRILPTDGLQTGAREVAASLTEQVRAQARHDAGRRERAILRDQLRQERRALAVQRANTTLAQRRMQDAKADFQALFAAVAQPALHVLADGCILGSNAAFLQVSRTDTELAASLVGCFLPETACSLRDSLRLLAGADLQNRTLVTTQEGAFALPNNVTFRAVTLIALATPPLAPPQFLLLFVL